MAKQNAYIGFNGKCREAMTFYQTVLGGELIFMPVADTPMACNMAPESQDSIMHSSLISEGSRLMGTDMTGSDTYIPGNNIALVLDCESEEEIQMLFGKLSEGAEIRQPLGDAFWGGIFGFLTDKFGINWMFNYVKLQS